MAGKNGQSPSGLKTELLANGPRFSFFQALRLLTRYSNGKEGAVRVKPELSLAFPAADISQIEELPGGKGFEVTATFLGLYGVSSPLPSFYTEDLFIDRREDSEAAKDFADILHRRLYLLLYDVWKKYRLFVQVSENNSTAHLEMLYALAGLSGLDSEGKNAQDLYPLLRYTGLFGGHPRSALGLQTMLSDFLQGPQVELIPCIPRSVKITVEQRFQLGDDNNTLGENALIGEEVTDHQSKFRIKIGPLTQEQFRSVLPGGSSHQRMAQMINNYLVDPLEYDFSLVLSEGEAGQATLGGQAWSHLGLDTVLYTGVLKRDLNVVFPSADISVN